MIERVTAASGHRERKKLRTKERLTEAALRLFTERGYAATRIEDIVAEVDVVPRTFFRYFSSKDDALFHWYDIVEEVAVDALRARPAGEGIVTALRATFEETTRIVVSQKRIAIGLHCLTVHSQPLRERLDVVRYNHQRNIARVLAGRQVPADAFVADMIAAAVCAVHSAAIDRWAADNGSRHINKYVEEAMKTPRRLLQLIDRRYVLR